MILTVAQLQTIRPTLQGKVVATNGVFDLLHVGHARYLSRAKSHGDVLIVGLNSDASVKELKGPSRPIHTEQDRAELLMHLASVHHVCIFKGKRCVDFLEACKPDVYVKGGDYTLETLDPDERAALGGAEIVIVPLTEGHSTTRIIQKVAKPIMDAIP